jgi:hypothetical protein
MSDSFNYLLRIYAYQYESESYINTLYGVDLDLNKSRQGLASCT